MGDLEQLLPLVKAHREMAVLSSIFLGHDDIAIVAGAYKGDTIEFLASLHDAGDDSPEFVGYEPQDWAFKECLHRFSGRSNVRISPYALGTKMGSFPMYEWNTDACSFVELPTYREMSNGYMNKVDDEIDLLGVLTVELLVLNIEGYEHELIPYMHEKNMLQRFSHIVMQVHEILPGQSALRIDGLLSETHALKWFSGNWYHWERALPKGEM